MCIQLCLEFSCIVSCRELRGFILHRRTEFLSKASLRPVCHSGAMNLLHVGTVVTPEPAGWTGGHLEVWEKFHCVSENLDSSFKDCEILRKVAGLEWIGSLETIWSKFVINWCQIWHYEVQEVISVFPRQVSTFHSPHACWFTELFCMSVCAL